MVVYRQRRILFIGCLSPKKNYFDWLFIAKEALI
jgi:hypothetical protein